MCYEFPVRDIAFIASILVMVAASLYFSSRLKGAKVAMQWGFDGKPTWFAPKVLALWGLVGFALFIRLLIYVLSTFTPDKIHGAEIGLVIFSIVLAITHVATLIAANRSA